MAAPNMAVPAIRATNSPGAPMLSRGICKARFPSRRQRHGRACRFISKLALQHLLGMGGGCRRCPSLPSRPEGKTTMKKIHLAAAALVAIAAGAAQAQVSVGVGLNINVPGVYGRVDIGAPAPGVAFVPPPVVYEQPVVVEPSRIA